MTQATVTSRTIAVEHIKISSKHSFEEVRQKLEGTLPKYDRNIAAALRNGDVKSAKDYEENGPTLSIVAAVDHGADLQIVGRKRNALLYEIGNPLTATKMTRHQLPAALYAPLRVVLFEDEQGRGVFEYDKPSSFFAQYGDERVTEEGRRSDADLEAAFVTLPNRAASGLKSCSAAACCRVLCYLLSEVLQHGPAAPRSRRLLERE
jgi:uncharacterized protein (DUF302 family)